MTYRLIVFFVVSLMCTFILTACQTAVGQETPIIVIVDEQHTVYRCNGKIDRASAHRLEIAMLRGEISTIQLNSPGGSIPVALRLASLIRTLKISTTVVDGANCSSACVSLLMAGVGRSVGNNARIGIHSPYMMGNHLESLSGSEVFELAQSHIYWYIYASMALVRPDQRLALVALLLRAHHSSDRDTLYWVPRGELRIAGIID